MRPIRLPLDLPAIAVALVATIAVACEGAVRPSATHVDGPSAAPTVLTVDQLSLPPSSETAAPAAFATPGDLVPGEFPPDGPSEGVPPAPPEGVPPPPPEVTVDYTGGPDDAVGFVAEYRQEFGPLELADEDIVAAGARLCTYLQRHATTDGSVDIERAMTEADVNEPGYPRLAWLVAFRVAVTHYCGEFSYSPPAY